MKLSRLNVLVGAMTLAVGVSGVALRDTAPVAAATGTIWIQTMDSCSNALGGATYELVAPNGPIRATTPANLPASVGTPPSCPLEQGSCSGGTATRGCVGLPVSNLPAGTYTLRETATPPANATNPGGYASCEGGSACQLEVAKVTVDGAGNVSAVVTSIYPDGTTTTSPKYNGSPGDPIVWHDYGLGSVTCPTDSHDPVADQNTGTPSTHCAYSPDSASQACTMSFPWQCTEVDADTRFVDRLYSQLLGRSAQPSEAGYWDGQLDAGLPRASIGYGFLNSTEFHEGVVQADYQLLLGRAADSAGEAYWTSQLDNGAYNETILAGFASTPEYFAVHGGNYTGFVQSLYSIFLGRQVSSTDPGVTYWVGELSGGMPRTTVAMEFTNSHEYHMDEVATWYPKYLGRAADSAGQAYWAGVLDNNGRDESIESGFIGSPEYFFEAAS